MKKTERIELPVIEIPTPCPMKWEELSGGDRKRYCDHCTKHVFNFSEMPAAEVKEILDSSVCSSERVCAQIRRREDGSIMTAENRPARRSFWRKPLVALATSLVALLTFTGCESELVSKLFPWLPNSAAHHPPELGDIAVPPAVGGEIILGNLKLPPTPPILPDIDPAPELAE